MLWVELNRASDTTLTRQIYDQLVARILAGDLAPGTRLPSSRDFAAEHRVARNIVMGVYEQLLAEGFVETREGAGTYVSELASLKRVQPPAPEPVPRRPAASADGSAISFVLGTPDLSRFPREAWARALRQVVFYQDTRAWGYAPPGGSPALRSEIAQYLLRVKGIRCSPEQVIVTMGAADGLRLSAAVLKERRAGALVEDPVVGFVPSLLKQCGHPVQAVRADDGGLDLDQLPVRPRASLLFVSPSHQCPLGSTLPIQRRLGLIEYAHRWKLFIVEDDYDSEFRYTGAPVSSLCRLSSERVIHVGTFSKSLAPALRLGYLVVPAVLAGAMEQAIARTHNTGSWLAQEALARFIREGHLERHIVRMQRIYHRKMKWMVKTLHQTFGDRVTVSGNTTGLHLCATFRGLRFDSAALDAIERSGVIVDSIDQFALGRARHPGALAIAFGHLSEAQIEEGVHRLAAAVRIRLSN